jgi:hypothetical protein
MIVSTGVGLKFVSLVDRGQLGTERVHLVVTRDGDMSYYVLLATHALSPQEIASGNRLAYWFEPKKVREGDHIVVYTRPGTYSRSVRPDGRTNHFFFWERREPLFGAPNARVVIAELNTWETGGA